MLRSFARQLPVAFIVTLAGCGATQPMVSYEVNRSKDLEGYSRFQLQRSTILIDRKKDKDGKDTNDITLTSVPTDPVEDPVYSIIPADSALVKTHLKIVHRPNTTLIESLGTEIEDKRVQFIQQVGSIITGAIGFFGLQETSGQLPKIPNYIDVTRMIEGQKDPEQARKRLAFSDLVLPGDPSNGKVVYDVTISATAPDALARDEFLKAIANRPVGVLFYSACRDVQVSFKSGPLLAGKSFNVRISDPNFVQTVQIPAKGKIEMHTGCGVNVSSEKSEVASDAKVAAELIAQVKAIRDAHEKAAKPAQTK